MDEKNNDQQLVEEIRALRADLRRYAVIAMWLLLGVSVLGFVLFSNHASEKVIERATLLIPVLIVIGIAWQVGLIIRSEVKTKVGPKSEQAESAILSGRTSGSNRKP